LKAVPVLFENDDCIVLNKPAGLPVQGGAGVTVSLDRYLAETWTPRPLLVHRLDKDTSGVILAAKHTSAAARFAALFSQGPGRGITKQYLGICAGSPPENAGRLRFRLEERGTVKRAETAYTRLGGNAEYSLLALELCTGRTHQIRRHLAFLGNPLLGDDKYGDFALNRGLRKTRGIKRLLLHAYRLVIDEKAAGFPLDVAAPPPDYFSGFALQFQTDFPGSRASGQNT
jgi:23S rRNA pseudouridine955/2504/2580 synthase